MAQLERKRHVFIDSHMRIERIALEYHRNIAVFRLHIVDPFTADQQISFRDVLQPGDHTQGGGFPASGGAYQNDELLVCDLEIELVDRSDIFVINFLDVSQT